MLLLNPLFRTLFIVIVCFLFMPAEGFAQSKRKKPPKRDSNIKSVDAFVYNTFELYHKVFVYDSLTIANVEIPAELEDELMQSAERDIDSLMSVLPDVIEDMSDSNASIGRKAKATLNLNKAKKALKFCVKTVKVYVVGTKEDED